MISVCYCLSIILITISAIILVFTNYLTENFDISFATFIFTIKSPIIGTGTSVISHGFQYCVPRILVVLSLLFLVGGILYKTLKHKQIVLYFRARDNQEHKLAIQIANPILHLVIGLIFVFSSVFWFMGNNGIWSYLNKYSSMSSIYEDYYVDPKHVTISNSLDKPKNLIYIVLESMETKYKISRDDDYCECINNLTNMAEANISFGKDDIYSGGLSQVEGAGWTIASLLAQTSGVHWGFPIRDNSLNKYGSLTNHLTTIGDVLQEFGYNQEFLCGSDADFAGRRNYFTQHGYKVYDYHDAVDDGYTDDYVWWGLDDECLYRIAKDELNNLYGQGKPFNFTMLTVDTHYYGGYVCDKCQETYNDSTANVLACADRQVAAFVEWLKEQPFAENTVIIIVGDHLRMDTKMVTGVENRKIYNCIINSQIQPLQGETGREACSLDMFPTTLAAMGFYIPGNRLGLGTNLFSDSPTLIEEFGLDYLNSELSKASQYFDEVIVQGANQSGETDGLATEIASGTDKKESTKIE